MSQELTQLDDFEEAIKDLLLQQFKGKPNFENVLAALAVSLQAIETMLFDLWKKRWLDNATGLQLDNIGSIVGVARNNLDDDPYRLRIRVRVLLNISSGTPDQIMFIVALILTGVDATFTYSEFGGSAAYYQLELFGAGLTQAAADEVGLAVDEATPAGVGYGLVYSITDDDNTFTFSDDDNVDSGTPDEAFLGALTILTELPSTSLHLVADDWTAGTNWVDRSTGSNNGVRVGSPTLEDSVHFIGRKCIRGGLNKGFHAPNDDINAATLRTYEVLVDDYGSGTSQYLIGRTDSSATQFAALLYKNFNTNMEASVNDSTAAHPWMGSTSYSNPVIDGEAAIFHVVLNAPARTITLYLNGVALVQNNNPLFGTLATPTGLSLGIFSLWNDIGMNPSFFNGTIMEVLRHETAFDQATVTARSAEFLSLKGGAEVGGLWAGIISNT